MTFREGCFVIHVEYKYLSETLEKIYHHQFYKRLLFQDNISQLDYYDAPFCEQQYTHGSCCISLFKFKSFDQFKPPELPEILDIYSVVAL